MMHRNTKLKIRTLLQSTSSYNIIPRLHHSMRMSNVVSFDRQSDYFWMINTPHFQYTRDVPFTPSSYLIRRTGNWDVGICLVAVVRNIFTASKVAGALLHLQPVTKNLNNIISVKDLKRAVGVYLEIFNQSFSALRFSDGWTQFAVFLLLPIGGRRISCYDLSPYDRNARSLWHPEDHQQVADSDDTSYVNSCVHYATLRLATDAHTRTRTHTHAVLNRLLRIWTRHSHMWCNSRGCLWTNSTS